jgi:flavin-dependent dehydrogenase
MFDVIVVGGRCAGAATAVLLARKGFRVLVVDKARFPAEIPHGHFTQRQGLRLLQRGECWTTSSGRAVHR